MDWGERERREQELGIIDDGGAATDLRLRSIEHLEELVDHLRAVAGDDSEHAHWLQDVILFAVVRWIADASGEPATIRAAEIAASVDDIEFSRWFA